MKKVLSIAGSDCSGGAGIQADLKTMTAMNVYGMSVITALTAQNTTGVYGIAETPKEFVAKQIDCIFTDIIPDAVKIGMVSGKELVEVIADKLTEYEAKFIVLDPVMVSTSGSRLLEEEAAQALMKKLIPCAYMITPNIPEAEVLSGLSIRSAADMINAAKEIAKAYQGAILIKGGHGQQDANDLLYMQGEIAWFEGKKIDTKNTHGTGCTLSSAIACGLAKGYSLEKSVREAKEYISGALGAGLQVGKGNGPLNHCFRMG
ncbi:bifunctional hydroxymethylpyrimidine kinase/phosphomethylpyrimidine kinase [Konateibacter massiliensis]|uniref:bifunctional hydroxymethylpyrimidine kinase/phosphomethylpyrimidine kinase n=1 Tax=Konateibacter massiliensis TaxID=2002841 RepID=UPI001F197268|nr:bifunctional hydroxymethylpyrimidine kinase/phosphomethylpyrimidine kinase [Konateibacter massiliensis]